MIMDRLYGGVCYAGIDTDPELKYPKVSEFLFVRKVLKVFKNIFQGAGRVAFSNQQSYIAAISARFVQLQHGEIDKRVEVGRMKIIESEKYIFFWTFSVLLYPLKQQFSSKVKPYVLDDQLCDECQGGRYSDE